LGTHTPSDAIGISIIISILHDFGKSPTIAQKFVDSKVRSKHHHISANFAKAFLLKWVNHKNKKLSIKDDFIDTIYNTINVHHDHLDNRRAFLNILIQSDTQARRRELKYLELKTQRVDYDS
jgi:hypothetical protein